jgi:DNA-binding beta-propeller fold protein YncE
MLHPRGKKILMTIFALTGSATMVLLFVASTTSTHATLSATFQRQVLVPPGEAPYSLRLFSTPVKTDSNGNIITGPTSDPVKNVVGAESAGLRAGMQRFTQIMFGAKYDTGEPDPGTRIDPNNPSVSSGSEHWPFRDQPFRSWPNAVAITPDGKTLYATLPGREGYPDWRIAAMDTGSRSVSWIDLRASGISRGTRPVALQVSPKNTAIYPQPYLVVLNEYGNFASVVDTSNNNLIGEFQTGFYGEGLIFNSTGTRLYITDRFKDEVRAFRVDPGPFFTQIAEIPTGTTDLQRTNPRNLDISADGNTLYVANTLGHTIAVINIANDANTLVTNMIVGGLATDVKIAGRWGIVSGHETNTFLNQPETGHGLPTPDSNGNPIKNNGQPLGYTPIMTDATKATTFDDIGSELNLFDTTTNQFVFRYVDAGRDQSMMVIPGQTVDLGDHTAAQKIIQGSGPEQMFVRGNLLFVSMMHSDKVEVFRINQNPSSVSGILTELGLEFTGGITPQGVAVSPDGKTVYVANMQTEDVSVLSVGSNGALSRQGYVTVGVTGRTPDPTTGNNGQNLFATDEEVGLRWLFTQSYSDDGQKSCGFCHWRSQHDGGQWNVGANALGGVKSVPQNKDVSDNWPEWYEGLNNSLTAYASSCNGELVNAEKVTTLFPQPNLLDRLKARDNYVQQQTAANSQAIGRKELSGKAYQVGYYDMAYLQILWTQNEVRRLPNPLAQFPSTDEASIIARGKFLFSTSVEQGGAGCADCHHNGNQTIDGVPNNSFQDYNIHEPGVIAETTVDGNGPFLRAGNDYFFQKFGPLEDEGSRQNVSSRNTKHLRTFWDSVPRWLHHGLAHSLEEILLPPDSPLLGPNERGFNFRTVRSDNSRAVSNSFLGGQPVVLPTEVPITAAGSDGKFASDGNGPLYVSLDSPTTKLSNGTLQIDQVGTSNLAPLVVTVNGQRQINPALAQNNITVIKDTHGKTSNLSANDIDALIMYLKSLE